MQPPSAERRGTADAEAFLERPGTLRDTMLADFGAGGPAEAAFRRMLHALHARPGLVRAGLRLLGDQRADRAREISERYAYWCGARRRLGTDMWRQLTQGTAILMYHALGPPDEPPTRFVVPARRFERQLRWLARRGRPVLRLEDLAASLRAGGLAPAGAVVITIDDGYADNQDLAAPLLRRFDFPAVVFAVSDRVGGVADWDGAGELTGRPLLDWDGLRRLRESRIAVGAHTRTHPRLPDLGEQAARDEIEGSRTRLTEQLGTPVEAFSYPYGRLSKTTVAAVENAGFGSACGIERGLNYPNTPLLELRRVPVHGDASMLRFALGIRFGDPDLLARLLGRLQTLLPGANR